MTKPSVKDSDDDYTMGDVFRAQREHGKQKRAANRESSPVILKNRGIGYTEHNGGAHLIITHNLQVVDFWPGTGKFIFRSSKKRGHGVFNMLDILTRE